MRSECEEIGDQHGVVLDSQEVDDISAAVEECEKRLGDFGMSYESTYGRWVERQVHVVACFGFKHVLSLVPAGVTMYGPYCT